MRELKVDATLDSLQKVTDFVDEELETAGCPADMKTKIDIAIDEIFGNIVRYAYGGDEGSAAVRVDSESAPGAIILTFLDSGAPFNPLLREDPDTTLSASDRKIGGLGIFMVKKLMDEVLYEYKDGQNILTLRKWL